MKYRGKPKLQKGSYWDKGLFHFVADNPFPLLSTQGAPAKKPLPPVVTNPQPVEMLGQSTNQLTPISAPVLQIPDTPAPENPVKPEDPTATMVIGKRLDEMSSTTQTTTVAPKAKTNPFLLMRGFSTALSFLGNAVARKAQNSYDYNQQTALGQMNPMPVDQFQPTYNNMYAQMGGMINPFSVYARYGGNLKKAFSAFKQNQKYSNNAQMDMGDGKVDDQGMMRRGGMMSDMDMDDCHHCKDMDMDMMQMGGDISSFGLNKDAAKMQYLLNQQEKKKAELARFAGREVVKATPILTPYEQKLHDMERMQRNAMFAAQNSDYRMNEFGDLGKSDKYYFDQSSTGKMVNRIPHVLEGMLDASIVSEAPNLLYRGLKYGMGKLGQTASRTGVDELGIFTKQGDKQIYELNNGFDNLNHTPTFIPTTKPKPYMSSRLREDANYYFVDGKHLDQEITMPWARNADWKEFGDEMKGIMKRENLNPTNQADVEKFRKMWIDSQKDYFMDNIRPFDKEASLLNHVLHGSNKYGGKIMKKGGLTPNKAREILHDGTVHGKPITDKQRRYFGAMSKGNTLKYQKGGYTGSSVVDYLATLGYSGKKDFRQQLAQEYGIDDYNFSAEKNLELLAKMRTDDTILKGKTPSFTPIDVDKMMEMERQAMLRYRPKVQVQQAEEKLPVRPTHVPIGKYNIDDSGYVAGNQRPGDVYSSEYQYGPRQPTIPKPVTQQGIPPTHTPIGKYDVEPIPGNYFGPSKPVRAGDKYSAEYPYATPPSKPMAETPKVATKVPPTHTPIGKYDVAEYNGPDLVKNPQVVDTKGIVEDNNKTLAHKNESWLSGLFKGTILEKGEGINFGGTGFIPEGAEPMTKDLTVKAATLLLGAEKGRLAENWWNAKGAHNGIPDLTQQSKIVVPVKKGEDTPPIIIGKPLVETKYDDEPGQGFYHAPVVADLYKIKVGTRSRYDGWKNNKVPAVESKGFLFSTMGGVHHENDYMFDTQANPEKIIDTAMYIGADKSGKIKIGYGSEFKGKPYKASPFPALTITGFAKDDQGRYMQAGVAYDKKGRLTYPIFNTPNGTVRPNLIMNKTVDDTNVYDRMAGGKAIFATPDRSKAIFVAGSVKHIDEQLERFKKENNINEVLYIMPDNGSAGRTIFSKDGKFTPKQLAKIDARDLMGGAYFYLTPDNKIQQQ